MSFNTHNIYHPLIVNSGWTSQSVSATTISAGTFYGGSLSATYVGNQNVTNQEFSYVSGLTSNTQTQLNNLVNRTERLLTFQSDDFLTDDRVILSGYNTNVFQNGNLVGINANYRSVEVGYTSINISQSESAITDWNPVDFNSGYQSTLINVTAMTVSSIISGLSGGTQGRIVIIQNNSTGLIILENKSSKCNTLNRFLFSNDKARFLVRGSNITLIYIDGNGWCNLYSFDENGDNFLFNDFTGIKKQAQPGVTNSIYGQFRPFAIQTTDSFYLPKEIYSYSPKENTNGVIVVSASTPLNTTRNASFIGPTRGVGASNYTVTVSKLKLDNYYDYTGLTNTLAFSYLSNISNWDTGAGSTTTYAAGQTAAQFWITPITSVTRTNTTNWYIRYGTSASPTYSVSSVPLSSSTSDWIYLGIYRVNDTNGSFFYSYDGHDYQWERFISGTDVGSNGGFFSLTSSCQITGITPTILSDWIIINKGY